MCLKVWCVDGFGERSDSIHVSRYVSKIIMLTTSVEAIFRELADRRGYEESAIETRKDRFSTPVLFCNYQQDY